MRITSFARSLALVSLIATGSAFAQAPAEPAEHKVELQQIRNATVKVTFGDTTFLIDPMLAAKGDYPGFEGTYRSELRNPLVDLPLPVKEILSGVDAVIVTHTHLDHWDEAARQALPKSLPIYVQHEADAALIRGQGFTDVRILGQKDVFGGVTLSRTGGQHGTDAMYAVPPLAEILGKVMGVVFKADGYQTIYLVGDTIWRPEVDQALEAYKPGVVVLNTGRALVNGFEDSIIMGKEDVLRMSNAAPDAAIVTVHMDAVNHMSLTREALGDYVREKGIEDRVLIPADGERLTLD